MSDLQRLCSFAWKKSTASGDGNCVEVARGGEKTLVRDSKDPSGPTLAFLESAWREFLVGARTDQFNANATGS